MIINPQAPHPEKNAGYMFREIFKDDCYRIRRLPFQPAAFLDIGANVGFFAVYARALFPNAIIRSLEPCAVTAKCLRENVAWLNVEVIEGALGKRGTLFLEAHRDGDGSNLFRLSATGQPVESKPLQEWIEGLPRPLVIKLDCEGGEESILQDPEALKTLATTDHWAMEYHAQLNTIKSPEAAQILHAADPRTITDRRLPATVNLFISNHQP